MPGFSPWPETKKATFSGEGTGPAWVPCYNVAEEVSCVTPEALVQQLLGLPPAELRQVLQALIHQLEVRGDLRLAREVIEQYRPALEELASR